jgi:gamma-glutamyltranspeptidase / glutathione hydrolase
MKIEGSLFAVHAHLSASRGRTLKHHEAVRRLFPAALALSLALRCEAQSNYWGTETLEAQQMERQYAAKRGTMGSADHAMVAACHSRSVEIGVTILQRGGNAVDAFIATTLADYVQAPGTSSIGGPLALLTFQAKSAEVHSLVAPLKAVFNPDGQWTAAQTAPGKQVLIPGAVAGLELLHRKQGRLPWRDLVAPAAQLAEQGFEVDPMYSAIIATFQATLAKSAYGRATYFHADGTPLKPGELIKLPAMAATLRGIARHGSNYLYRGAWRDEALHAIAQQGGLATARDFSSYRPTWGAPLRIAYRGHVVYALGAHDYGGARLLLGLEVLEKADVGTLGHYSESLDGLETMLRVVGAVNVQPSLYLHAFFEKPADAQAWLDGPLPIQLWREVSSRTTHAAKPVAGSHSYSLVVIDADGNAVAGTHTIESLPFGGGIFAGGVPLNNAAVAHPWKAGDTYATPPGEYIVEPMSATLAVRDNQVVFASSTFDGALWPADLEVATSALDFDWSPERIALAPRFGTYAMDIATMSADAEHTTIDKRFNAAVLTQMEARGLKLTQSGYFDTGMAVIVRRDAATGRLTGFTPEPLADGKAAGY